MSKINIQLSLIANNNFSFSLNFSLRGANLDTIGTVYLFRQILVITACCNWNLCSCPMGFKGKNNGIPKP